MLLKRGFFLKTKIMIDFTTITITELIQTVVVSCILYAAVEMIIKNKNHEKY